ESAVKEIVPDEAMGRAQAANQGRDAVLQLAGGPLGGVLLAVGGWLIGAAMAVCQVVAMVTAWMLQRTVARPTEISDANGVPVPDSPRHAAHPSDRLRSGTDERQEADAAASEVGIVAAVHTAIKPN